MIVNQLSNIVKIIQYKNFSKVGFSFYSSQVRVRFAPSPTGYLHLGGLRTALYNLFFAKKHNGVFILRIEDTDQTRLIPGAIEALCNDLLWAGIEIHEGPWQGGSFGPYIQSKRLQIYKDHIGILLNSGSAYPCFCTDRRLQLLRREALKAQEVPKYDNKCRGLSKEEAHIRIDRGEPYCIRFKITDKEETFDDLIYGKISLNISLSEGDPVIIKSDGYPTYHYANVVDDHLMQITHVLRGVEWQNSTTKHIMLYRAFGWSPPSFGHLPLLMNPDGSKLSKRQGDIKISHYKENYIFPLALVNFITSSGGGFGRDQERYAKLHSYTMAELCNQFDLGKVHSYSGKLMFDRLLEFNNLELRRQFEDENSQRILVETVKDLLKKTYPEKFETGSLQLSDEYIIKILKWALDRIDKLPDLVSKDLAFIWTLPTSYNIEQNIANVLPILKHELDKLEDLRRDQINVVLKQFSKDHNLKYSQLMKSLRLIFSGLNEGASIAEMIEILGKENTLNRIDLCLNKTSLAR